jgi:hypothetical protein
LLKTNPMPMQRNSVSMGVSVAKKVVTMVSSQKALWITGELHFSC